MRAFRNVSIAALIAALNLIALPVHGEDDLTDEDKKANTELINSLSDCAGVFEAMSEVMKATGKPHTADQLHQQANGAESSAAYLLSLRAMAEGKAPKAIGDYMRYPEGRAETAKTAVLAAMERNDTGIVKTKLDECMALQEIQNDIVQLIRDDMIDRK